MSGYASWQVVDIWHICKGNNWVLPSVYQGRYNAITRDVEGELIPALRKFGIKFNAYNPLAGGLLTGKYSNKEEIPERGRFALKKQYQSRYWKASYFKALEGIRNACKLSQISMADAALRWMKHHSVLKGAHEDGIIFGATCIDHFKENLRAFEAAKLPESIVDSYDKAWETTRSDCPKYFNP
jgi:aflatoxin B1 aldehyde reductase